VFHGGNAGGEPTRFLASMRHRRTVRHFSSETIPIDVVRRCIETAALAASGANKQPWTFVLVTDPAIKARMRQARWASWQKILGRPENERAYLLIPVGYPTSDCVVPDIGKKSLSEVLVEV
jgi:iodotyrosine deiodinase